MENSIAPLLTLFFVILGLSFMVGGKKLAAQWVNWVGTKLLDFIEWVVTLPIKLIRGGLPGGKKKKKRK